MVLDGQQTTQIAITGPGGIGKSQLELELAYRTQQNYKNCSVFWISAADMDSFYQACSYVAQKLSIPGWDDENQDPRKLLQVHLSRESKGKWLHIYDNADDASQGASNQPSQWVTTLLDFIPQSDHGCIIFTTASSNTAEMLVPENTMQLGKLAAETAAQILRSHLTNSSVANEEQEAKHLLGELSCLSLAIKQAAAYIKHNKISIRRYLELLSEQKDKTMNPSDKQCGQQLQYQTADNPVALTSLISLAQVSRHDTTAASCLFFMACIDRKDVLLQLLLATPSSPIKTIVDLLNTYAIIIKRPASSAVELHRLVHLAIRNHLQRQGRLSQWNQEAIAILAEKFPSASHENRSKWRRLLPLAKYALANSDSTISLAVKYAIALYEDGHFNEAEKLDVQVMETSKTKLRADHPSTLTSMANLAFTWKGQGRLKDALDLMKGCCFFRTRKLGPEHPDTISSMVSSRVWQQEQDSQRVRNDIHSNIRISQQ
ncbi:hypothetical protein QBC37DRAFT_329451 [Rhypophila decipiens]|uniref:Kinesin light chain n=1 Tax=Rhypophila decipiens TaxID=261697 RepID=A0AAN7AYF2_9PEZI|nr:hypothetical protein QBC37DRAFT_329451 [Rhypophila decipiens]